LKPKQSYFELTEMCDSDLSVINKPIYSRKLSYENEINPESISS